MGDKETKVTILVVDDEIAVREVVARRLEREGYACRRASDASQALAALEKHDFSLIISDIMMPGISGIDLLRDVRRDAPETAIIMLTGVDDRATANQAIELGAYGYIIKPFELSELLINVTNALRRRELEIQRNRYEQRLEEAVRQRTQEIQLTQNATIYGLATLAECRDVETGAHIMRTQKHVRLLTEALATLPRFQGVLDSATIDEFYRSTPLHDIGKVGVPDAILTKPGKLTAEEFEIMKKHTIYGRDAIARAEEMLGQGAENSFLRIARELTATHHEKWDGSGYPCGLKGEEIPLVGRIMAIIDIYDALVSLRVYKPPFSHKRAVEIITQGDGRVEPAHFDPDVLAVFIEKQDELRQIAHAYAETDEEKAATAPDQG